MKFVKFAFAAVLASALTGPAIADTPGERDAARRAMIAGFTCHLNVRGHNARVEFLKNGTMELKFNEGVVNMKWWVESDEFCTQHDRNEPNCAKLAPTISRTEKRQLLSALSEDCL